MTTSTGMKVVQPYLFFNGNCEQALNYYTQAIGAEITAMMRFKDSPQPPDQGCGPNDPNKIMHASFKIGESELMASDGCEEGKSSFQGFSLSIAVKSEAAADEIFSALAEGGKTTMPLGPTFFAPKFGMVEDRFGINWMVIVVPEGGHGAGKP